MVPLRALGTGDFSCQGRKVGLWSGLVLGVVIITAILHHQSLNPISIAYHFSFLISEGADAFGADAAFSFHNVLLHHRNQLTFVSYN
jgi:hypothetical protein